MGDDRLMKSHIIGRTEGIGYQLGGRLASTTEPSTCTSTLLASGTTPSTSAATPSASAAPSASAIALSASATAFSASAAALSAYAATPSASVPCSGELSVSPIEGETYLHNPDLRGHEICIRIRSTGNDTFYPTNMLNDTGSTMLSLTRSEALLLNPQLTENDVEEVELLTANGVKTVYAMWTEIQVVSYNGTAISEWFPEKAAIHRESFPFTRLSGSQVRNVMCFATLAGQADRLYVARNPTSLTKQIIASL